VTPERDRWKYLATLEEFLADHNAVVMFVVMVVFGAKRVGDGPGGGTR